MSILAESVTAKMSDSRIMEPSTELRSGLLSFGSLVPGPEPNGELGSVALYQDLTAISTLLPNLL